MIRRSTGRGEVCDLLPAYVLGQLSRRQAETVRRHMASCDRCLSEVLLLDEGVGYVRAGLDDAWEWLSRTVAERRLELDQLLDTMAAADDGPGHPVSVMLASPSEPALATMRDLLAGDRRFSATAEVRSSDDLVPLVSAHLPDLVVVHLQTPDARWLDALARIADWSPKTAVVMVANLDAGRAARLIVTSCLADDWAAGQRAGVSAGRRPTRVGRSVAAPSSPGPPARPPRSIIREAMRQMGIAVDHAQ